MDGKEEFDDSYLCNFIFGYDVLFFMGVLLNKGSKYILIQFVITLIKLTTFGTTQKQIKSHNRCPTHF